MSFFWDLRFAIRSLVQRRTYAAMVLAILGSAIGATSAIFALVDAVLLRPLPYKNPESLVTVFADGSAGGHGNRVAATAGDYADWRDRGAPFAGLAALRNESRRITSVETPVVPLVHAVSANLFDILGAQPVLGRAFRSGEDVPGKDDVVMLSYGIWQTLFGGDAGIIGRTIGLDARPHTIVGVMGPDFFMPHVFAAQPGLWVPTGFDIERTNRSRRDVMVYGRLRSGVTFPAAQASMKSVAARLALERPETNDRWTVTLLPLRVHLVGPFTPVAGTVLVAVGLVLLIACANVATLVIIRGRDQARDISVRRALGASRRRIVSHVAAETLVLAATGGVLGGMVAWLGIPVFVQLIPTDAGVPFLHRATLDGRVLAVIAALSAACALMVGVPRTSQAARIGVIESRSWSGGRTMSTSTTRLRRTLIIGQVALGVAVAAGAVLMVRTLISLEHVPRGFRSEGLVKLRSSIRGHVAAAPASRIAHFEELRRRLSTVVGVRSVSAVSFEPPTQAAVVSTLRLRVPSLDDAAATPIAIRPTVMPGYFETMGIPIVKGRGITDDDRQDRVKVAVVSETMAKRYFTGIDPVGRSFSVDGPGAERLLIVGVVGDVMTAGTDPAPQAIFYVPYAQNPVSAMTMVMRVANAEPAGVLNESERMAWSLGPWINVYNVETMDQYLAELNWRPRFAATTLSGFTVLAVVLAGIGLYAIAAYSVVQRRNEIGLRMAIGATSADVVKMIVGEGLRVGATGVVLGNLAALVLTRAIGGLLYGVAPGDPTTLIVVSMGLLALAIAACVGPALRATRIEPQTALRQLV